MKKSLMYLAGSAIGASMVLSGCASHSHELKAAEVSDVGYRSLACNEIHAELQNNVNKVLELSSILNKKADDDSAQMAIGAILFWPVLFALEGGDGVEAAEYSRLKGEINAMEKVAIAKSCEGAIKSAQDFRAKEQEARVAMIKKNTESGGFKH